MATAHGTWKRLGSGELPTEDADVGLGHIVPLPTYFKVYATLVFCTVLTVYAATLDFGASHLMNIAVALAIATFKAGIVTLFFMHLRWDNKLVWGIVIYPTFIFILMVLGTLGDISEKRFAKEIEMKPFPTHADSTAGHEGH